MGKMLRRTETQSLAEHGLFGHAVAAEMADQDRYWGHAANAPWRMVEWHVILSREVGEVATAIGCIMWPEDYAGDEAGLISLRQELIQVAAVAGQMVDVIDQRLGRVTRVVLCPLSEVGDSNENN